MNCPKCGSPTRTARSGATDGGSVVSRIRACLSKRCQWVFMTQEVAVRPPQPQAATAGK